ncbi:hypothetical protein A2160_04000 [Candidatus Beckwithbacteria bacterium RBG_13_42_9]|uniref:Glycosyltransferase 2-like domain-containing protein n=1 Tax=Candidatus Beckwithbacteria bacterium RBG_13_42_9 TaxID=1797457 RepID=A0A1F5E3F1_9BACT|nr:MAG: hypothetical protein A2160_04000 [Candidatus Beckwithbacteria bacterium RBG_13_42_9]
MAVLIGLNVPLMSAVIMTVALLLVIQGAMATYAMFYTFLEERRLAEIRPNRLPLPGKAQRTFSLIVAAKNEEHVIGDTLKAMARLNYPDSMYEVLVLVRADDKQTIRETEKTLALLKKDNMRLIYIDGDANTKAYSLNIGAHYAQNQVLAVFDAEDEPHPDLLAHVDQTFAADHYVGVVQSGIQLINVDSSWFSALNSLEYYFWFKSVLPFLAKTGIMPLGGNTVFISKFALKKIGFWDEDCLTEDMDIGVRLAKYGFKSKIIYEEKLATLEETPKDEAGFIRQRSRWDQGYLQVFMKGDWLGLPGYQQRFLTGYILVQSLFRHLSFIFMILLPVSVNLIKVPVLIAMLSYLPAYFLALQWGLYVMGLKDLKYHYQLKFSPLLYGKMLLSFFPYQLMLALASLRAVRRSLGRRVEWEKTAHRNLHRLNLTYRGS